MSILIQNLGALTEHVLIAPVSDPKNQETVTIMPRGQISLQNGWNLVPTGERRDHLKISGSPLPGTGIRLSVDDQVMSAAHQTIED